MRRPFTRFLIVVILILLTGVLLRLGLYAFFGLDGDDMFSLLLARRAPDAIIDGLLSQRLDFHPPLHFLLLKGWVALTGDSLLALRTLNLLLNLLAGTALIRLCTRLFGQKAGLLAGLFWAVSPTILFAAYMIRMYTLLLCCVSFGLLCVVESARTSGKRRIVWFAGAALFGVAGVYSHLFGAIAFAALGFGVLITALLDSARRWRDVAAGIACFVVGLVLSWPWLGSLWNYYRSSGSGLRSQFSFYSFGSPLDVPGAMISTLLVHRVEAGRVVLVLIVVLALLASWLILRRYGRRTLPIVGMFWASLAAISGLAWFAHIFKTFYLAAFVPLGLSLAAGTVLALPHRTLRVGVGLTLTGLLLYGTYYDLDSTARDDPYAAAQFVEQHERPGDLVLVAPDWAAELFKYHYRGQSKVVGVFQGVSRGVDLDSILPFVTKGYSGVWVVRFQVPAVDPDGLIDAWFSAHAVFGTKVYPFNIPVSYYDLAPQQTTLPTYARSLNAQFGDLLALRGVYLPVQQGSARDTRLHPPSNWVQVVLYWEALKAGINVQPRVRFTDGYGQVFGGELNPVPDAILLRRVPIQTWQPGQIWQAIYTLNLNPDTPPGVYNIEVTALDPATGQQFPASGPDAGTAWVIAGKFTIR